MTISMTVARPDKSTMHVVCYSTGGARSATSSRLTYLLHSWPVANTGRNPLKRLAETLRELNKLQPEILGPDAVQTLMGIEDDIEELRKTYHGGK